MVLWWSARVLKGRPAVSIDQIVAGAVRNYLAILKRIRLQLLKILVEVSPEITYGQMVIKKTG